MIGFIKKLISGILSFLFGLFGGKKSQDIQSDSKSAELPGKVTGKSRGRSGYYLELDDKEEKQPAGVMDGAKIKETVASATQSVKAEVAKATDTVKAEVAKATDPVKEQLLSKAESAKNTATAIAKDKPTKAEAAKGTDTAKAQPVKVELVQTAEGVKVEPAKPAKAAGSSNGQVQAETTFAPKYLIPTNSNSRRRPGPNMSTYLDMARQVKTAR